MKTIKDDLSGWMLNRVVWVADSGFNSGENRAYLQQGGGHYIVAEQLRWRARSRGQGRTGTRRALSPSCRQLGGEGGPPRGRRTLPALLRLSQPRGRRDEIVARQPRPLSRTEDRCFGQLVKATPRRARRRAAYDACLYRLVRRTKEGLLRVDKGAIATRSASTASSCSAPPMTPSRRATSPRLQAALRGRAGMARPEGGAPAATGLPLPRGPHPRPCAAVLAGAAAHPHRRTHDRRHLAQREKRARPDAPRHARDRGGPRRPRSTTTPPSTTSSRPWRSPSRPASTTSSFPSPSRSPSSQRFCSNTTASAVAPVLPGQPGFGPYGCLPSPEVRSDRRDAVLQAAGLRQAAPAGCNHPGLHPYQVLARTISRRRAIGPGHISQRTARILPVSILVKPVGGMGVAAMQIN